MRNFEFWILAYLLNSLWQVPLLFAAGWLAARALRSAGAEAEHRVWVITLVLQSLLPAVSIFPFDWLRAFALLSWNAEKPARAMRMYRWRWVGELESAAIPLPGLLLANGRESCMPP